MSKKQKVAVGWSGGKDSAMMLHALMQSAEYEPVKLLTSVTETFDRISMHGVRRELLVAQAEAAGLALHEVRIPWPCPNELYEEKMAAACEAIKAEGITIMAFGDLFLEDVRAYRDVNMAKVGMHAIYPLWGSNTRELAQHFIAQGFRAILCCVDTNQIPAEFAGRDFDEALLADLPESADPCGENGEFHTFVHAGPVFSHALSCTKGEVVLRGGFAYADLLPAMKDAA